MARSSIAAFLLLALTLLAACGGGSTAPGVSRTPVPAATAGTALERSPTPTATAHDVFTIAPTPVAAPFIITNATLIDGTGAGPRPASYVMVRDGLIAETGPMSDIQDLTGETVIDAEGAVVMPGLIDGHVHITRGVIINSGEPLAATIDEDGLLPFYEGGLTTLRDVGTATVIFSAIKSLTDRLERQGRAPHIVWAGPLVTTIGGYPISNQRYSAGGQEVASAEEGVALVDTLWATGAQVIKFGLDRGYYGDDGWPLLSLEEVRAISERAHAHGMHVTAHVTSLDEVRLAIGGGVDSLAHAPLEPLPDEMIQEMVAKGMGIVSTATIWIPGSEGAAANTKRYADAGGTVSVGTDFGCCAQVPGNDAYIRELLFLQEQGMTPMQLLVAATHGGAELAGLGEETGTIEAGKQADLIIVDGDPLEDIGALADVRLVVSDGRIVFER